MQAAREIPLSDGTRKRLPPTGDLSAPAKEKLPIRAEVHTDDHAAVAIFDARAWFEQASDQEIFDLATENGGYGHSYAADAVGVFFEDDQDVVGDVFAYQRRTPRQMNGDTMGFEVEVDEDMATAWLRAERPHLIPWIEGEAAFTTPNYKIVFGIITTGDDDGKQSWEVSPLAGGWTLVFDTEEGARASIEDLEAAQHSNDQPQA
jgi:hypothetical protein